MNLVFIKLGVMRIAAFIFMIYFIVANEVNVGLKRVIAHEIVSFVLITGHVKGCNSTSAITPPA